MPNSQNEDRPSELPVRWGIGLRLGLMGIAAILWVRCQSDWPFQKRNLMTQQILCVTAAALLIWWTFLSRAPQRWRLTINYSLGGLLLIGALLFRLEGLSGDMSPIIRFRWAKGPMAIEAHPVLSTNSAIELTTLQLSSSSAFPQFYGPNRNGVLAGLKLATNWSANPPRVLWRKAVGAGWGGFAIVGDVCVGQEQRGAEEHVVLRKLSTGEPLWSHADRARYSTIIGGEGPRATPTVVSNRVYALGATGILNCLDLATGKLIWSRDVVKESGGKAPEWGAASSPLWIDGLVIVHGGEESGHSLLAFRAGDGALEWKAGDRPSYASPVLANLAGVSQVLAFNDGTISGHDPRRGTILWQRPWGNGNVVCSLPLVVSSNRVLFSSGYGVGAELLELSTETNANGGLKVATIWKSIRMKAKFSHLFVKEGCVLGLDDGIFACVDLKDGSQRWKEGRYGHGQGLLVGDLYLLMGESGELILLQPSAEAPGEIGRFPVFASKTWNPIALSGDLLLVRNDREAVCLRLPLAP